MGVAAVNKLKDRMTGDVAPCILDSLEAPLNPEPDTQTLNPPKPAIGNSTAIGTHTGKRALGLCKLLGRGLSFEGLELEALK